MKAQPAVAVLGHYGQLNLGDEAITAAAITGVRSLRPDCRIVGISLDPRDTRERHGIESFALRREVSRTPLRPPPVPADSGVREERSGEALRRIARRIPGLRPTVRTFAALVRFMQILPSEFRSLRASWRALEGVELVMIAGSNQILDQFGGAWGFPYTLLRWTLLARLRRARVVLLSVGAGPLDGWLGKRFLLWVLHLADYASTRDPGSAELVRSIGWRRPIPVLPDLAFGLESMLTPEVPATNAPPLKVAVNLMPVHDPRYWPGAQPHVKNAYLDAMAGFVERLLAQGHQVELFGTQPADEWLAEEMIERIAPQRRASGLSLLEVRSLDELARLYRRSDVIAATRFHGILLALRFARPIIGVCYYRKSRELMQDFGVERYAFDLYSVTSEQLADAFDAVVGERAEIERRLKAGVIPRARELTEQYQRVLATETGEAVEA